MVNPATCTDYYFEHVTKLLLFVSHSYTFPNTLWLALFTNTPGLSGSPAPSEVSTVGTGYARQSIAQGGWTGPSGANMEFSNTAAIVFGTPLATPWGTINSGGLYDEETGGNLLFVCRITTPRSVSSGDGAPRVLANALKISRATC